MNMMNTLITLSILTLNIWGLPDLGFRVLAPLRVERVQAICEELKASTYDVVILQEVWVKADRQTLSACGFPFMADRNDPRRPLDSGLVILSRIPIAEIRNMAYERLPDYLAAQADGETLARKGALMVRLEVPGGQKVWIANTHLVSQYEPDERDRYFEIRKRQFMNFLDWTRAVAGETGHIILGGDFNFTPHNRLGQELKEVINTYRQAPGSDESCTLCPPNSEHADNEGKVDYLMATPGFNAVSGAQAMTKPFQLDDVTISLSDHFGWESAFRIN